MVKLYLFLAIVVLATCDLTTLCDDPINGYNQYLRTCEKTYSADQKPTRAPLFYDTCIRVKKHNSEDHSYKMAINCKADVYPEELVAKNMVFPKNAQVRVPPEPSKVSTLLRSAGAALGVAAYTNWRANGITTTPKNQGSCGSCWTFATTAALESAINRVYKKVVDLSQEQVLQCTNVYNASATPASDCNGGVVDYALKMINAYGLPLESARPYVAGSYTGAGNPGSIAAGSCFTSSANFQKLTFPGNNSNSIYVRYNNINHAQIADLLTKGTLVIAYFADTPTFGSASTGVYVCPVSSASAATQLNHAMELVGMTAAGDYIIKNSWGTSWGDQGYATISQTADCGITSNVYQLLWDSYSLFSLVLLSLFAILLF